MNLPAMCLKESNNKQGECAGDRWAGGKIRVNDSRRRSTELQAGRIALGGAPVAGPMQSRRPVRGGGQVGRVRIQTMLPDRGLSELERVRIVGCDGMFNDGRRFLWRPIVALGRPLVAVCGGCCRDVLP